MACVQTVSKACSRRGSSWSNARTLPHSFSAGLGGREGSASGSGLASGIAGREGRGAEAFTTTFDLLALATGEWSPDFELGLSGFVIAALGFGFGNSAGKTTAW